MELSPARNKLRGLETVEDIGDIKIRTVLAGLEVFGVSNSVIEMLEKGLHLIKHSQTSVGPHYTSYQVMGENPPRHLLSNLSPQSSPQLTLYNIDISD